ncbi:hypothetical protein SAMN05216178_5617 [Pseudomonas saponiphila]|uniref:Uncharacterized protein n=1 Tax=Pseudomonas saponiphila TaxID=556534 RepID=A0A1H4WUG7_9PSED|nr:hypothetical protein [Pseudomonas saponiphila]SEC96997.1 hypothetical protein SAMN05216178_5617 [Pseudomonas saponiphila]
MGVASAEDFAGFNWVFGLWENVALTIMTATEPLFVALNETTTELIVVVGFGWLLLVILRLGEGAGRTFFAGILIFLLLAYGMRPATVTLPSGASVRMVEVQAVPLKIVMAIHVMYRQAFDQVLSDQTVAGTIVPAQAAIDNMVGRSADVFAGSDLARLIRDYNASCAPAPAELAGPEHAAKVEALHAIGLLGGGGLGIPDKEVGLIAQARTGLGGAWTYVFGSAEENGGWGAYLLGGGAARTGLEHVLDQRAIQSRREAGTRALESAGPFMGSSYALPTQAHWAARLAGQDDATPSYLPISKMPNQKSTIVGDDQGIMFRPSSCVEAYQIAQMGAEQAYQALRDSGQVIAGGQRVSAEVGAVSTAVAWQRFMARSLERTTGMSAGGTEVAGGILAAAQMFKNFSSWLDLQTLLPGYVIISAWLFWIVLILAPLFLLLAPLRGATILVNWLSLLLLPVIAVMTAQMITVAISQTMAAVAVAQAGAASGWTGVGADYDGLRGLMSAVAAVSLGLSTWITSSMLGVSLGGLAGSLSGAVATASDAGRFAMKAVGVAMLGARLVGIGAAASSRGGGGSSPQNGAGVSPSVPRPPNPVGPSSIPPPRPSSQGAGRSLNPPKPNK